MHGLGIPTTRGLCIVGSDHQVYREQIEPGAMLVRMAPSHVRFGSFEILYYRKQHDQLKILADYVIAQHNPHLVDVSDKYAGLFSEVVERTAKLIAQWQAVGWAHGVMNTNIHVNPRHHARLWPIRFHRRLLHQHRRWG